MDGVRADRRGPDRVGVPIKGSGLTRVEWQSGDGRRWVSLCPTGTLPGDAERYPLVGPPDMAARLDALGLSGQVTVRIHNDLVANGLITAFDVLQAGARERISGAIQRALRLGVEEIVAAYTAE